MSPRFSYLGFLMDNQIPFIVELSLTIEAKELFFRLNIYGPVNSFALAPH